MFPPQLEQDAFRASNGEFGWIRTQVPVVVNILRSQGMGILGGERWWVQDASTSWAGVIPQRHGPPEVYVWETRRESREALVTFCRTQRFRDSGCRGSMADSRRFATRHARPGSLQSRLGFRGGL
jgi:hypothetical protein